MAVPVDFLRALSNQYLPDTCTVQRVTEVTSGDGTTSTWSNLATDVSCRVSPAGSGTTEATGGDQSIQALNSWTVWLPAGQDVTVKDRLVVGSRTFEVNRVGERSYEVVRECLCSEIL